MQPDLWLLYRHMLRSRRFEQAVADLWRQGRISGEMHLGTGEEAVAVGVVAHLREGDALALDHRGTPPLVARGVDLVALLRELLGRPDGLCAGHGGHMHLFSPPHLAASSGIVGAAGPAAAGFALAAQLLRPGAVAVGFFGEGAMNAGMLLEALNLAAVWKLPALFVCKDNDWSIVTRSPAVTGGSLLARAQAFGLPAQEVDGLDVEAVWRAAGEAIARAREGGGPAFLLARCAHLEGHFLGDPLLRVVRRPLGRQVRQMAGPLVRAAARRGGASPAARVKGLRAVSALLAQAADEQYRSRRDPLARLRDRLKGDPAQLTELERAVAAEIEQVVAAALADA